MLAVDVGLSNLAPPAHPSCVSVREGYERWASTYDCAPNPLLNLEERKLAPLLPILNGKHVLDLACGTGRWLERLVARGAGFGVGVDTSTAMLHIAGKKAVTVGRLAQADCLRLPFRPAVFDLVICSFALGHILDLNALACQLAGVMKPQSELFVTDLHPEAYARGWRTGFREAGEVVQIEMLHRTAEAIVRVFHTAGFECLTHVPLCLGEPEKPIFVRAGKEDQFKAACRVPAVLLCQFKRVRSPVERWEAR